VEDGGETEGDGDGEAERAHTALDDEVGAEFREKNAGMDGLGVTLADGVASKENRVQDGDGGGDVALVVW
jgi:hypothetical protein